MPESPLSLIGTGPLAEAIQSALGSDLIAPRAGSETRLIIITDVTADLSDAFQSAPQAVYLLSGDEVEAATASAIRAAAEHGIPAARVIGSGTVVDSSLLRRELAGRVAVHVDNVHIDVVGVHGAHSLPLWSSARIAGTPLPAFRPRDKRPITVPERSKLLQATHEAATRLHTPEGAGILADAITCIANAILNDQMRVLNVTSRHEQFAELEIRPACFSAPTVIGAAGVVRVIDELPLNPAETAGLAMVAERRCDAETSMEQCS